jgi:hypothetical protein
MYKQFEDGIYYVMDDHALKVADDWDELQARILA